MKRKIVLSILTSAFAFGLIANSFAAASTTEPAKADSTTKTIYLNAGGSSLWDQAGAKFAVWSWDPDDAAWTGFMESCDTGVYKVDIPSAETKVIFGRFNSTATTPTWEKPQFWNQTIDLTIDSGKNCFTITGWGGSDGKSVGEWSSYVEPTAPVVYTVSVNDADPVTLVKNGNTTEYKFEEDVDLKKGDKLEFFADGEAMTISAKADSDPYFNNVTTTVDGLFVHNDATTNLYLDVLANTVWVGGYEVLAATYSVSIDGGTAIDLVKNGETNEYKLEEAVEMATGKTLTFYCDGVEMEIAPKENVNLHINNVATDEDGNLVVRYGCTDNLYLDVATNKVWVGGFVGEFDIYFGAAGWDTVNVYTFNGEEVGAMGAWPGAAATNVPSVCFEKHEGQNIGLYKVTIPYGGDDTGIIFNDGGSKQTADLAIVPGAFYGSWYESTGDTKRGTAAYFVTEFSSILLSSSYSGLEGSACGIAPANANYLVGLFDSYDTDVQGYINAVTFWTYTDTNSTEADKDVSIADMMVLLNQIVLNETDPSNIPSFASTSNSTLVIIVAISGISLLVAVFFINKKRKATVSK